MLVPAHVEDGDSEGSLASTLGVGLLDVTKPADKLLARDALAVGIFVSLSDQPQLVGQKVGVGGNPGHRADHVVVQFVDLLRVEDLVQQLIRVPPLSRQHDAVVGEDSKTGASVSNGFHGVLHLSINY